MCIASNCQSDFEFNFIPQTELDNSPFDEPSAEVSDIIEYLDSFKKKKGYDSEDLVLVLYNGVLNATEHCVSNLFCAGTNVNEEYPGTSVISLKYIGWNVLEEKYNYEVQKHSILHLIVCAIIGSYTNVERHDDIGCLLDINNRLTSFNLKLQKGYYLCSSHEFGCYETVKNQEYGNSIIKLCEKFKSNNYQSVINNINGDNNIQVNVGKDNSIDVIVNDELSKKSYGWQKWGVIIGVILSIMAIIATIIYS